jgi:hypothetical protein
MDDVAVAKVEAEQVRVGSLIEGAVVASRALGRLPARALAALRPVQVKPLADFMRKLCVTDRNFGHEKADVHENVSIRFFLKVPGVGFEPTCP